MKAVLLIVSCMLLSFVILSFTSLPNANESFYWKNIEMLNSGEEYLFDCPGNGSVDCPEFGVKAIHRSTIS